MDFIFKKTPEVSRKSIRYGLAPARELIYRRSNKVHNKTKIHWCYCSIGLEYMRVSFLCFNKNCSDINFIIYTFLPCELNLFHFFCLTLWDQPDDWFSSWSRVPPGPHIHHTQILINTSCVPIVNCFSEDY